ncbi:SGNH/GDSL hydrolase family protein [Planctomycetota bacterium]
MRVIWFCAAGHSFFVGIGLIIVATLLSAISKKLYYKLTIYSLTIIGGLFIFLSATPLPLWFYIILATSVFVCFLFSVLSKSLGLKLSMLIPITALSLSIVALLIELPYYLKPSFAKNKFERLYIIGDSVSAGIGNKQEKTWPKILRTEYNVDIVNLSESGATVATAIHQAAQITSENAIVLLEIGGNDLFVPKHYFQFEQDLRQILEIICNPKRTIVMLELPLLPHQVKYGKIQRALAKQFNVILIPKRFFVSVLSAKNTSTDLAHLSPSGHEFMAKKIWSLIGSQLDSVTTKK